jgi:hypothetical protein
LLSTVFVIENRKLLCHSLGRPSRSDFVQLIYVRFYINLESDWRAAGVIPVSNELNAVLVPAFGECRGGGMADFGFYPGKFCSPQVFM